MILSAKEFDALDTVFAARRVRISRASAADLEAIYPKVSASLPQHHATLAVAERVRAAHPDNLWAIRARGTDDLLGVYAMAMLTHSGHDALLTGRFDATDPAPAHIATPADRVSAIYKWGVYAPGRAAAAIPLVAEVLKSHEYAAVDLYGTGSTAAGRRIMLSVGFRPVRGPQTPDLFHYNRLVSRTSSPPRPGATLPH